jgi:HlyD family secretion protein
MSPSESAAVAAVRSDEGHGLDEVLKAEARSRLRRRLVGWLLALSVLGGLAGLGYWLRPMPVPEAAKFRSAPITLGEVVHYVSATGRLEGRQTVQVGAQISGRIASVEATYNDHVQSGQVLLRFEQESLRGQISQARAQLKAAQAAVTQAELDHSEAKRQLDRTRKLVAQGADTLARQEQLESAVALAAVRIEAARAQVEIHRATFEVANTNLTHSVVRSPISGVVLSRNVEPGQTVAAQLQAPVLFVIAEDLREMRVIASIDEADIGELSVGQEASFTVDAFSNRTFAAELIEIRNAAVIAQGVVTYDAVLDVDNADLKLRPGMTASVKVRTSSAPATLRVPNAALRFTPPNEAVQKGSAVWLLRGEQKRAVAVEAGVSDGTQTAVKASGLREGDQVLVDLTDEGREAYDLDTKK